MALEWRRFMIDLIDRDIAAMSVTRRMRLEAPLATLVDAFRSSSGSAQLCDALAQIAMRLVDTQDREHFQRADGATAMLDHLARVCEEQATLAHAWQTSDAFGTAWAEHEVHDSLVLTLVAICHASVDAGIARELNDLHAAALLFQLLLTLPSRLHAFQIHVLECLRNLSFVEVHLQSLPKAFVPEMWSMVLQSREPERQEIAADILGNIAFHSPTLVDATQQHIAALLALFFASASHSNLQISLADLLCNLSCDASLCLLLIYELDEHKPQSYKRHSGAVFFADVAERTRDRALRQSMEALAHNISWSDPAGKRNVQKLALSSYLRVFAAEPAINN